MSESTPHLLQNRLLEGLINMPIILFLALLFRGLPPLVWIPLLMLLTAILINSYRKLVGRVIALEFKTANFISIWLAWQVLCVGLILMVMG